VLVDQPELYLHSDVQLGFVHALGRLGVDNQLFLATGSPEITRTAQGNVIQLDPAR
jgi:predicted ATP-dependent endonuclease of OLD family